MELEEIRSRSSIAEIEGIVVVMKAMVHPYRKEALVMTDAFRGPMASAFKLHLEDIMLFQDPQRFVSVHNIQHPF